MELVNRIRDNQKNMSTDDAINAAIESCIEDGIMTEFLIKYRAEVFSVCITEFDEKVYTDGIREEGREEGRREGHEEGREEGLKALVESLKDFLPDLDSLYAAIIKNEAFANVTKQQVMKYYKNAPEKADE